MLVKEYHSRQCRIQMTRLLSCYVMSYLSCRWMERPQSHRWSLTSLIGIVVMQGNEERAPFHSWKLPEWDSHHRPNSDRSLGRLLPQGLTRLLVISWNGGYCNSWLTNFLIDDSIVERLRLQFYLSQIVLACFEIEFRISRLGVLRLCHPRELNNWILRVDLGMLWSTPSCRMCRLEGFSKFLLRLRATERNGSRLRKVSP